MRKKQTQMVLTAENQKLLENFIVGGLEEDLNERGDLTSLACIDADDRSEAYLLVKDPGVLAGVEVAEAIIKHVDPTAKIKILKSDGDAVSYGDIAFELECNTHALLKAERLILNTMQRMSGIATLSNRFKFEVEDLNVSILDTRKTTPLIRFLEKWSVKLGGCENYRFGLFDWFMIKDNHVDACGSIKSAIQKVHDYQKANSLDLNITVEVRNLIELYDALEVGGFKRLLLDNFEIPLLREAVAIVDQRYETEASGGINIHNVREVAKTGVDYISIGAITHSATSLDLSLKVKK